MSWFEVYLWTRLDAILSVTGATALIFFIAATAMNIMYYCGDWNLDRSDEEKIYRFLAKFKKPTLITFLISLILTVFVPSKEQAATIYVLPKIANSEIVKQVPDDLNDIYKMGVKSIKESLGAEEEITQIKKDLRELKDGQSETK